MKKILLSFLILTSVFVILDRGGAFVLDKLYHVTNNPAIKKRVNFAEKVDADIVFMGASRTEYHIDPSIIQDSTLLTAFNAGFSGKWEIYSKYIELNLLLSHHKPKLIVLGISPNLLRDTDNQRIDSWAPHLGKVNEVDETFKDLNNYNGYIISHLYRYNTCITLILSGLLKHYNEREDGFHPLPKGNGVDELKPIGYPLDYSETGAKYLEKFFQKCKDNEIDVLLLASPYYAEIPSNFYSPITDIADKYDIKFFDYHSTGLFFDHPEYFRDYSHFDGEAAIEFSKILGHDLKEYITGKY